MFKVENYFFSKEPHIKRKTREQSIRDKIIQGKPVILWHQINNLKAYYVEVKKKQKIGT